jgi:heat shock protein HtpX
MTRWNNQLKTVVLLGALSALLVGLGGTLAPGRMPFFLLLAVAMNVGAYFFSDKLVLKIHRAQPILETQAPRLHAIVRELATSAGIPMPRLYRVPSPQPNAFATGRNPEHGVIAVTDGITQLLSERELRAVLAHEIGHIKNRDILVSTIAAAVAGAISYIGNMLQFTAFLGGADDDAPNPIAALAIAIVAPIGATLVHLGISRSREFLADETGAHLSHDPHALASALGQLERGAHTIPPVGVQPATASLFIMNPFAGTRGLAGLFSTHPPVAERIRRLRSMTVRG